MNKSILTEDLEHCYLCGKKPVVVMHSIFGSGMNDHEIMSRADGLVIPLCWNCNRKTHLSGMKMHELFRQGQLAWEEKHPGESFRMRYGKDFL